MFFCAQPHKPRISFPYQRGNNFHKFSNEPVDIHIHVLFGCIRNKNTLKCLYHIHKHDAYCLLLGAWCKSWERADMYKVGGRRMCWTENYGLMGALRRSWQCCSFMAASVRKQHNLAILKCAAKCAIKRKEKNVKTFRKTLAPKSCYCYVIRTFNLGEMLSEYLQFWMEAYYIGVYIFFFGASLMTM